jgi:hypothetical protein
MLLLAVLLLVLAPLILQLGVNATLPTFQSTVILVLLQFLPGQVEILFAASTALRLAIQNGMLFALGPNVAL